MGYDSNTVERVRSLRRKGFTMRELARMIGSSPDTIFHWVKDIKLNKTAEKVILKKRVRAQEKGRSVIEYHRQQAQTQINVSASKLVKNIIISKSIAKLCCSLIYWCEGGKNLTSVRFTNSNPTLIKLFLALLRQGFEIKEKKFRGLIHLHEYHNETKQKLFWSTITGIPIKQFSKSFLKPHTGNNTRVNYPGCLAIYYFDAKVAKEVAAIYNTFGNLY